MSASWVHALGAVAYFLSWYGADAILITTEAAVVANKTFSYVVIGGGTAGLTVASRLAEDLATSVLVIEAGPNAEFDHLINDPGQSLAVTAPYNWEYNTTAQVVGGNVLSITQGKVLGGSSSINGMCWTRGTIDQYDSLEKLGNPGWNFETLLSYMKAAEHYHLPNAQQISLGATVDPKAHGFKGKVDAGFPQPYEGTAVAQSMVSAALTAIPGLTENKDVASGAPNGAAKFQYSIKPGNKTEVTSDGNTRSSSANAFIYPSLQEKPNLVILTGHQATRLVWGPRIGSLSVASGVKFAVTPAPNVPLEEEFMVEIAKEAIVASGAIGSPHFLELSGIGDSKILEHVGIPVEVNLPAVGTNLQEQALNIIAFNVASNVSTADYAIINAPPTTAVIFADIEQILGNDDARVAGDDLLRSVSTRAQKIVSSGAFTSVAGLEKILQTQAESIIQSKAPVIEFSFSSLSTPPVIGFAYWNLIPQWRGTVHVKSNNPSVHPELDPRFFTGADIDIYLKGNASRLARDILNTHPLNDFIAEELLPGLGAVPANASGTQWQDYVKSTYVPTFHPVGSVSMLPKEDGGAVGPDLIVYGTSNVRVVDSSILPVQISAHLSSTVYGIAEKAVDMIKHLHSTDEMQ